MTTDVACDFAATSRVANEDYGLEIEMINQFGQVVGLRVHVVAVPRLARAAMPAAIVRDAAITVFGEEHHL